MSGLYSCRVKVIRAGQELAGSTPSTVQRSLSFHGQGTAILYCSRTFSGRVRIGIYRPTHA